VIQKEIGEREREDVYMEKWCKNKNGRVIAKEKIIGTERNKWSERLIERSKAKRERPDNITQSTKSIDRCEAPIREPL
jgi:hypothetical protein